MMEASLLYQLHSHRMRAGVQVDGNRFQEVFTSKYQKVRIFKVMSVSEESKAWVADPANRICDAPGSWYCTGQYPPALRPLIAKRKNFAQLEDFNTKKDAKAKEEAAQYQQEYMERMAGGGGGHGQPSSGYQGRTEDTAKTWADTQITAKVKEIVKANDVNTMAKVLQAQPAIARVRSKDGRGPLWWAYEMKTNNKEMIQLLKKAGARDDERDAKGVTPISLASVDMKEL